MKAYKISIIFFVALIIAFFIGNRDISIGSDTLRYMRMYSGDAPERIEPIFMFIIGFFNFLNLEYSAFLALFPFFLIFSLALFVGYKCSWDFFVVIFVLFLFLIWPFFWSLTTNVLRQCLGLSFFILSLTYLKFRWPLFIVSLLCHYSMIIPFSVYFFVVSFKGLSYKYVYFLYLISVFLSFFDVSTFVLKLIIPPEFIYYSYFDNPGYDYQVGFRFSFFIMGLTPYLYHLLYCRSGGGSFYGFNYDVLIKFLMFGSIFHMFVMGFPYSDRLAISFWFFYPILFIPFIKRVYFLISLLFYFSVIMILYKLGGL